MDIIAKNAKCNTCKREYNYYDYLAHSEICNKYQNIEIDNSNNNYYDNYYGNDYDNIGMGYETDTEVDITLPNLYNSYALNYPRTTINTNPKLNNNSILEELMSNQINNLSNQLANIGIGIAKNDLYKYSNKIYLQIPYDCAICLETHNIGSEYLIFNCGHIFCLNCSNNWFEYKPICPLCKKDIRL